jgi:predicted  nucleic acid-binding Zn-ribbon protein
MVKGKCKNLTNRNQDYLASSEHSTPTTASPGYPNTLEKQDLYLKFYLMMLIEDFKKDITNFLKGIKENTGKKVEALKEEAQKCLKELQENTGKQVKVLKEETQKSLKELQENTIKQVKELNKTIQDLKMEVETITKSQREKTLQIEHLGKKLGVIDASINNRIQDIEERIWGEEDSTENINTAIKAPREIWGVLVSSY